MKKILSLLVCVCLILSAMVITASAADTEIVFDFGANKASGTAHADGNDIGSSKSYTVDGYTLALTNVAKCYDGANDATGKSALKLGTSKLIGEFTFTAPDDVTSVIFKVAQYKANTTKVAVNGTNYSITTASNNGEYTPITVDTTSTKTITFKTVASNYRCMVDSITFVIAETTGGGEPACTHTATSTEANGNETHKVVCDDCGETVTAAVDCTDADVNGKCDVCGGDVKIPVQYPAADSELTIADAAALGAGMTHNTTTDGKYYVTGKIKSIASTQWGNMTIEDAEGNTLYIYGTYSADGETRYDALDVKPAVGDTVKLYGVIGNYNGAQMKNGWIIEHTPATPDTGDDNTGDDNTGDDNTGDDNTGDDTTEDTTPTLEVVDSVVAEKAYKFGMVQGNVSTTDVYYLAGGMDRYYMATTTDVAAAIDVFVEETTGGYYLYTMVDGAKTYINMVVSADGAHVNGAYEAVASTVYTFDATSKTFVATVNDELYWFATRNDNTYTTLGPAKVSYEGFYGQFYAEPVVDDNTGDDNTGDDNTTDDNEGESTVKPEVKPEGDKSTTSPATGDNMGAVVALAMIAGAAVVFANKKR